MGKNKRTIRKRIAAVIACFAVAVSTCAVNPTPVQAFSLYDNRESGGTSVSSHKQFVNQIYKLALKRESSGTFTCAGNGKKIFDGDLDALFAEVCAIDKKTSDDADYLANKIGRASCRERV